MSQGCDGHDCVLGSMDKADLVRDSDRQTMIDGDGEDPMEEAEIKFNYCPECGAPLNKSVGPAPGRWMKGVWVGGKGEPV